MAAVGGRRVGKFRERNLLAVEGVEHAGPGSLEDVLLGDGDDDLARTLAVKVLVLEEVRVAVGIQQLDTADEFEVLAVDGQLLATTDFLAVLLGEAGDDGMAEGQVLLGFRLVVRAADDQFAAGGSDAGRGGHADHAVADMLDRGDAYAGREHDLFDVAQAGAADGHRLAGHDLRREEHLDAQPGFGLIVDLHGVTCREHPHQGDGQH